MRLTMEQYRRNQDFCGGVIYWMFDECWPCLLYTSGTGGTEIYIHIKGAGVEIFDNFIQDIHPYGGFQIDQRADRRLLLFRF